MTKFVNADFVFWEVEYANGTTVREGQDGLTYGGINRATLKKFKLVNAEKHGLLPIQMLGVRSHNA